MKLSSSVFCVAFWKSAGKMPRADRSRRKSSNQLAFVAESESRVQLHCTCMMLTKGLSSYDVNVWTRCFSKLTLLDWIYHYKYLLWWQPHIMSCGVLKPFAQRCQRRQSVRFHVANWLLGKRFAITIVRDTTFAQTTTTQSFANRWVPVPAILWLHPLKLYRKDLVWTRRRSCQQPTGNAESESPFRMSPDLFLKVYLRARGS